MFRLIPLESTRRGFSFWYTYHMQKIYITKKYILANSALEAIQLEKNLPVDDCWAEENTHKDFLQDKQKNGNPVGFQSSPPSRELTSW